MRKLLLTVMCVLLVLSVYAHSEEDSTSINLDEKMKPMIDAFKDYNQALADAYKEMSKYHKPYYTYDNSRIQGVAYIAEPANNENFSIIFYIENKMKTSFDVSKINCFGVDNKNNIFKFEFLGILFNSGIKNSSILNPEQKIEFLCITPFADPYDFKKIKEVYIKIRGSRFYFVPEESIDEYAKPEKKYLRKARDFFRDFF